MIGDTNISVKNNVPRVSIVIVHYNTITDTSELLESIQKLTYPLVEVIIVDNSNDEKLKGLIAHNYPHVILIQSETNLGFAGGNNIGIKRASGDYILFLNSDTIIFPDSIEPMVSFLQSNRKIGMASPKVLYPDNKTIQYAGANAISLYTGRGNRIGLMEIDKGQYDFCKETQLGHGAALIIPREVIEKVGLWPEIYFLYYEEHDWCEQIKRAGYLVYYLGNTKILHKEAMSTGGTESPLKVFYMTRNRILFMRRNSSGLLLLTGLLFFMIFSFPKHTGIYLLKGQFKFLNSFLRGVGWHFRNQKIH